MSSSGLLQAVREVLGQGEALLLAIDDATYATKVPAAFHATIGGHYRHCLDHFDRLFNRLEADLVDYDARKRDPEIETVRAAALAQTRVLRRKADEMRELHLESFIRARSKVSYAADDSPMAASTLGRELMFCTVHAIHHYALIGVMCGLLEVPLPEGFGIAPSTIKHNQDTARMAA